MKELERSLGLVAVVSISISAMLGSGIFVLPGMAAARTGPSVWLAYVLAGLCVLPAATCKAELATAMPTSGGSYVYLDRLFGPFFGTIAGVGLWLSMLLKSAFALLGFGAYLFVLSDLPLLPTALVLLAAIVGLNVVGVKKVGRVQVVIVGAALVTLAIITVAGFVQLDAQRLEPSFVHGGTGLLAAAGFVFVSYNGVTKVAAIAEEVRDPSRTLPRGILLSLIAVIVVYALVTLALVGNVDHADLGDDLRPIHTLGEKLGGPVAGTVVAVIAVLTMTSMANAGLLAASRFPFAMSRERLLPAWLERLSRRFRTPIAAIAITGVAMAAAIVWLDVEGMAKLASAIVIMIYVAESIAVVVFRESRVRWYRPAYRSPFYPWMQGAGIVAGLVLLAMIGPSAMAAAGLVGVPGALLYVVYGRRQTARKGVVGQRSRRTELLRREHDTELVQLEDALEGDAAVVVALFGRERSPEMLVETGAALANGHRVQVLDLTEVPEQTGFDAVLEEDARTRSLRRRIDAMAEEKGADIEVHPVVTRDLGHTVHRATSRVHCDWLVIEWEGRAREQLLPYNPVGWIINHLDSDLALVHDLGVRYVREILVYAEPGPDDALVVDTADHLAMQWAARITFIRFVPETAGDKQVQAEEAYLGELSTMCSAPVSMNIVRGTDEVAAIASATGEHDMLVMGAPHMSLWRMLRGTLQDRVAARAACSVLTVKAARGRMHEAFERWRKSVSPEVSGSPVVALLDERACAAGLRINRKPVLFERFARELAPLLEGVGAHEIEEALWHRERSQNTSVGDGVALPHATLANANRSLLGVFTTSAPIDYDGPDGRPVDVFFVTCGPPSQRQTHLELLSGIARLAVDTDVLTRLRQARTPEEVCEAVASAAGTRTAGPPEAA